MKTKITPNFWLASQKSQNWPKQTRPAKMTHDNSSTISPVLTKEKVEQFFIK